MATSYRLTVQAVMTVLQTLEPDIAVVPPSAPAPWGDRHNEIDAPPQRWCRIAAVEADHATGRADGSDGGHDTVVVTVSVGCNHRLQKQDPTRIERDADAVAHALQGAQAAADGQRVTVHRTRVSEAPKGDAHEAHRLFVVVATGRVERA